MQAHHGRSILLALLIFLVALASFPALSGAQNAAERSCVITDEEEYAVLAAVLFPNKPDIPERMTTDLERNAFLAAKTVRLTGFHGNSYTIQDETITAALRTETDRFMAEDYKAKNTETCKIDGAKLLKLVPQGKSLTLTSAEENRKIFAEGSGKGKGWDEIRKKRPLSGGITYLSRPGFNRDRTQAVVEARHQADYEMGVGYRVYLGKSKKTGQWIITGADVTRRS